MTDEQLVTRLQRALDQGGNTHDVADVVDALRNEKARFWEAPDGFIITELEEFPKFKMVRYWLAGGVLEDCLSLEPVINRYAVEQGCTVATVTGRKGWGPIGARTGWKPFGHVFAKRLVED